jgi:putative hydrolase
MKVLQDVNFPEAQILNVTPRRMLDFLVARRGAVDEFATFN